MAHNIFGIPQVTAQQRKLRLLPRAVQELSTLRATRRPSRSSPRSCSTLHRGQGMDLFWRDTLTCPTEADYLEMVSGAAKTGGLFRPGHRLHGGREAASVLPAARAGGGDAATAGASALRKRPPRQRPPRRCADGLTCAAADQHHRPALPGARRPAQPVVADVPRAQGPRRGPDRGQVRASPCCTPCARTSSNLVLLNVAAPEDDRPGGEALRRRVHAALRPRSTTRAASSPSSRRRPCARSAGSRRGLAGARARRARRASRSILGRLKAL